MQTTINLWQALCNDFSRERKTIPEKEWWQAAKNFAEGARHLLRPDSAKLCEAFEIAGDFYKNAGQNAEAAASFSEALVTASRAGAEPAAARLSAKLSLVQFEAGSPAEAFKSGREAIARFEALRDLSQHSMILNHLGAVARQLGDHGEAQASYERARDVATRLKGPDHPDVATALNNLGVARTEIRDYDHAESDHMLALGIREKAFGPMHPEVAQSMENLAVIYHLRGEHAKARSFYTGALKIYQMFCQADDPEMKTLLENISRLPEAI